MRVAPAITLAAGEHSQLERWSRGRTTPARLVLRAKIILGAAAGMTNKQISEKLGCGTKTVCLWRGRFARLRIAGIEKDATRGATRTLRSELLIRQIIAKTVEEPPPSGRKWSTRSLAAALSISPATVQRAWKSRGLNARGAKQERS